MFFLKRIKHLIFALPTQTKHHSKTLSFWGLNNIYGYSLADYVVWKLEKKIPGTEKVTVEKVTLKRSWQQFPAVQSAFLLCPCCKVPTVTLLPLNGKIFFSDEPNLPIPFTA